MPPEIITGRDVELFVVGSLCVVATGLVAVRPDGSLDLVPVGLFLGLGLLSFGLALWDIRTREARVDSTET